MDTPRLLIVDDSKAQRFIVRKSLQGHPVEIIGEAVDGRDAVNKYVDLRPDVVLLDLVMPEVDGQTALTDILDWDPGAKVIICSSIGSEEAVRDCLSRGALSFLQKPFTGEVLMNAILKASSLKASSHAEAKAGGA